MVIVNIELIKISGKILKEFYCFFIFKNEKIYIYFVFIEMKKFVLLWVFCYFKKLINYIVIFFEFCI